ncbi:HlyD family type I secretion periplasmic adaptor subunit [Phenylobacterium sp. J426]|uniref:HlyD family type I secretion periplasmic adaptor subunit n=1 Tax=Phenylobacterium sp. J426 TaxID=2898439 RepID=UPI002151B1C5|nr:HlyD family type I secretion periplasmic adaptor subunit [Phenylobacterium sp. J426]MCR5876523.1 HlyD family type I secretion periplasmic adaptor subunit [Phenylobacterium sp. J426]
MKVDLIPKRSAFVAPVFADGSRDGGETALQQRLRQPIVLGAWIVGLLVIGLGLWAAVTPLSSGVTAPAEVRVESNRKTLRAAREGGTIRQILVREGQLIRAGQPLILFNDVEARAAVDVFQNQYDSLLAQNARFTAEATGRAALNFPAELTARMAEPRVSALVRDQEFLFTSRRQLFDSQSAVLAQRIEQLETQVQGLQAQVESINEQRRLTEEELAGYRKLNEQGYAPKTLILRYERSLAELGGRRGQLMADIARLRQQMGETRIQLGSLRSERQSVAAEGLRESQTRLSDTVPRLASARQALSQTVVRSPVDGYVFNLTQFTPGGIVGSGEVLMDVVPSASPMTVTAMVKPEDVDQIRVGMPARVRLTGLNQRFNDDLNAEVSVLSADRVTNEQTGVAFYRVDLKIPPAELKKLKRGLELTPGMPATALIVTGQRTVLGYLISPITDTLHDAFREE